MSVDLDVKNVTVRFGGIVAVNDATLFGQGRSDHRSDRPERCGQDHVLQRLHRA